MSSKAEVSIGRVLRPWGREGAVVVEPWTHDPCRFQRITEVHAETPSGARALLFSEVRIDHAGRPIVRFSGIDSIDAAERLRGALLRIPSELSERPAGAAGTVWFEHELVGLEVEGAGGERVGRVTGILDTGGVALLVVRDGRKETLVPLAAEIIGAVDLAAGKLRITPPEGLIGLNDDEAPDAV